MAYQRIKDAASAPASPVKGMLYLDDTLGLGWYDGSTWVYASGGGGGGTVDSVVAGTHIHVDDTDPANPVVSVPANTFTPYAAPPTSGSGPFAVVWNGSAWVTEAVLAATETLHGIGALNANDGDVAVNAHKITGLSNGSASSDAAAFGQIPLASSSNPIVDGTAAPGTATTWSKSDHVHPSDTSRVAVPSGAMTSQSRSMSTTYQPNTTRPTLVVVTVNLDAPASAPLVGVDVLMDASSPPTTKIAQIVDYNVLGGSELQVFIPCTFIVPASYYYRFNPRSGGGTPTITTTYEYTL